MDDFPESFERLFVYLLLYGIYIKILLHCDFLRYINVFCTTAWKVAGSIPDGVIGIFH